METAPTLEIRNAVGMNRELAIIDYCRGVVLWSIRVHEAAPGNIELAHEATLWHK